jgi:hypothetical protein
MTTVQHNNLVIEIPDNNAIETKMYIKQALINSLRWYASCITKRNDDAEHVIVITDLLNALED